MGRLLGGITVNLKATMTGAVASFALLFALGGTSANAGNLIVNGSFETGDFTGWITGAISYPEYILTSPAESGNYAAQIAGFSSRPDTLTQDISTTAGQSYELSFWRYIGDGSPTVSLNVTWDGSTVFSELNPSPQNDNVYEEFTARVVGTGSDTLVFASANDPSLTYLDNVSLLPTGVPEPATWAMLLLGLFGVGAMTRSRRTQSIGLVAT